MRGIPDSTCCFLHQNDNVTDYRALFVRIVHLSQAYARIPFLCD